MNTIDLTPLYRSSVGFDRFGSLLNTALRGDQVSNGYPPYNIEVAGDNQYGITLAVAGFTEGELDIQVENGVLTVRGKSLNPKRIATFCTRESPTAALSASSRWQTTWK